MAGGDRPPDEGEAPVGEAPVSLAFFDPERGLYGTARRGLALLFDGTTPSAFSEGLEIAPGRDSHRAKLGDRLELEFSPLTDAARLGGADVRVCRVAGMVEGRAVDCLGTAAQTVEAPRWEELDAFRTLSALFDAGHAALVVARRPRGALGHGQELVASALLDGGVLRDVDEARLSTVYDGEGHQRTASIELWMPGEDFPRRATGDVAAGTTLEFPGLRVNVSVFNWRMEGREGAGGYELTARVEPPDAA